MKCTNVAVPSNLQRRDLLAAGVGLVGAAAASPVLAQPAPAAPVPRLKGPAVWLDMDQADLDAAYDQIKYAPNLPQITGRYASNSVAVRSRLGAPMRVAYVPTAIEGLDSYRTTRAKAPINIFLHGGAWRAGLATLYAFRRNCSCATAPIWWCRISFGCRMPAAAC